MELVRGQTIQHILEQVGVFAPRRAAELCMQALAVLVKSDRRASEAGRLFQPLPQRLVSIRFNGGQPPEDGKVKSAIRDGEKTLGKAGRILVRKSGTEPVIRVMAEGEDEALVGRIVEDIAAAIRAAGG